MAERRLIEVDKLKFREGLNVEGTLFVTLEDISKAPTVDAEPVRHGHWRACKEIFDSYGECEETDAFSCSECGKTVKPFLKSEYCPRCGAKMDEEDEDDN